MGGGYDGDGERLGEVEELLGGEDDLVKLVDGIAELILDIADKNRWALEPQLGRRGGGHGAKRRSLDEAIVYPGTAQERRSRGRGRRLRRATLLRIAAAETWLKLEVKLRSTQATSTGEGSRASLHHRGNRTTD